ncbi:hypothetical protein B7463_g2160, partial [Scytalidium lignicola]
MSWLHTTFARSVLLLQLVVLLPWIIIYYIPRGNRQHPKYSLHQATAITAIRWFLEYQTRVRLVTPQNVAARSHQSTAIPRSKKPIYQGPLADGMVTPLTINASWYPEPPEPSQDSTSAQQVLLHFHGGGYLTGSSGQMDSGYMARKLIPQLAPIALFPDYRLSCTQLGRFSAALQDAVSAYQFLLDMGYQAANIVLSGDSAGGHLALGLLRYISEHPQLDIPAPGCAFLWSPWIDVANSSIKTHLLARETYATDYLPSAFIVWAAESIAPKRAVDVQSPYITFSGRPFKTATRLWIHAGGLELFSKEIINFARQMAGSEGNTVELYVSE